MVTSFYIGVVISVSVNVVLLFLLWRKLHKLVIQLPLLTEQKLDAICSQFDTNGGKTLRDVVNRLEESAAAVKIGAEKAQEGIERLLLLSLQVSVALGQNSAATKRIEEQAVGVANNLEASQERADRVMNGAPGEAADAAAQGEKGE